MKKAISFLTLLLGAICTLNAQEIPPAEFVKEMNKIKMDSTYLYAEGTSTKSIEGALEMAQSVLKFEVENWLKKNHITDETDGVVMRTKDQCMNIQTQRGNLYRAFVYANKTQIMPYKKQEKIVSITPKDTNPVEKPTKTEKSSKGEKSAKVNKSAKADKSVKNNKQMEATIEPVYTPSDAEREMLEVAKAVDIVPFIKQNKNNITNYGQYKNRPESGTYYLFVYNQQGDVPACLKFDNGTLINVATGKEDSFQNYKGCGAYWFIKK